MNNAFGDIWAQMRDEGATKDFGGSGSNFGGATDVSSGVGSGIFGFLGSIASALIGNSIAQDREDTARKQNFEYGERAADNADARTRALYNDLMSPEALLGQYRAAGLSPSLMFGGGGIGGQTQAGAQGTGAAGISPTTYGINFDPLTIKQGQLLDAQTDKLKAETQTELEKPEQVKASIADLLASAGIKNAEEEGQRLQNYIVKATTETTISAAEQTLKNLYRQGELITYQAVSAAAQADFDMSTINERIKSVSLTNKSLETQIQNTLSQIGVNKAQIGLIQQQILQISEQLAQGWASLAIEQARAGSYAEYVNNLNDYYDEQIKVQTDKLKHEIAIDWAKYGLDITKTIKSAYEFHVGTLTSNLQHILPSGNAIVRSGKSILKK